MRVIAAIAARLACTPTICVPQKNHGLIRNSAVPSAVLVEKVLRALLFFVAFLEKTVPRLSSL
jgi:hypothetical protein